MKQSVIVSFLAHVLILAAVALWPPSTMPTRSTTITIQQIELAQPKPKVEPKPVEQVQPPTEPPKPKQKPQEEIVSRRIKNLLEKRLKDRKPTPTPVPTPVRMKTSTPAPTKPKPTPTPDKKIQFKPFDEISETQPTQTPPTSQVDDQFTSDKQVVFEEGFDYEGYTDRLMRVLQRNWNPPAWQPDRPEGIYTQVCFTILSNGTIVRAYVERGSGWQELDESALRAVRKASPVEQLPSDYGRSSVRAHVRFRPLPR